VVGGRLPWAIQQFHAPEFVQRDATPVLRRPYRLQAGFAFSTILVAKHPVLPFFVPSQPVRTKQTGAIVINGGNWPAGLHCRPNNPINILPKSASACSRNTHFFRLLRGRLTLERSAVYNTVILGFAFAPAAGMVSDWASPSFRSQVVLQFHLLAPDRKQRVP